MKNKPRHKIKQNGAITARWCDYCGLYDCNPMFAPFPETRAMIKRRLRHRAGLCQGCGHKICKCKNKNRKYLKVSK